MSAQVLHAGQRVVAGPLAGDARLRERVGVAVAEANRAVSEVAAECGIAWWTAHRILVLAAAAVACPAAPTAMIGIDETRARSARWTREGDDGTGPWRRSDPWMTSIVDLDPGWPGGIIGLAAVRSGASVEDWIALQGNDFRDAARVVVDHFHVVMLANQAVTDVRQRVSRDRHGRRGRKADPAWAHRQRLLCAVDRLGDRARPRLDALFATDDPTGEIAAAWQCKEILRRILAAHGPARRSRHETAHVLTRFSTACADAGTDETARLASTIERWWPEIEGFLELGITNARTEGRGPVIKQIMRVACGFRNQSYYERRRSSTARPAGPREPPAAETPCLPAKSRVSCVALEVARVVPDPAPRPRLMSCYVSWEPKRPSRCRQEVSAVPRRRMGTKCPPTTMAGRREGLVQGSGHRD